MKKSRLLLVVALSLSLVTVLFTGTACTTEVEDTTVAATVNGEEILERDVTFYIEGMRAQNPLYVEPAAWAQALADSGYTPETLRQNVIDLKTEQLVSVQEAIAEGYTVDEASIDEQIAQMRKDLNLVDDDAGWLDMLKAHQYEDEQMLRDILITEWYRTQLFDNFPLEPTDEELIEFIAQYPTAVEGYTLPYLEAQAADAAASEGAEATEGTEGEAQPEGAEGTEGTEGEAVPEGTAGEALPEGTEGTDGTEDAVDAGTDPSADSTQPVMPTSVPPEEIDLSAIPEEALTQFKDLWADSNRGAAFQEWITEKVENSEVVVNDMPDGLSYDVDMSLVTESTSADPNAETTPAETFDNYSSPEAVDAALAAGLIITDVVVGEGAEATPGSTVRMYYTGTLEDGTVFDSNVESGTTFDFVLGTGNVIKGWHSGIVGMKVGGTRTLTIPASLAYGAEGRPPTIPPNATLIFEVELVEVVPGQ